MSELRGQASMDEVRRLIELVRASTFPVTGGRLDLLEPVWVSSEGAFGDALEAGVRMRWKQGSSTFELVMPLSRLLREGGDLDGAAFYLLLAVDEPQWPGPDGVPQWVLGLPTHP